MDRAKAIKILNLPNKFTETELKKQYHLNALRYHPDKNPQTKEQFQEINAAFHFLKENKNDRQTAADLDYAHLVRCVTDFIINKKFANDYLNELDITTLTKIQAYINVYDTFFTVPETKENIESLKKRIDTIIVSKQTKSEVITLNPILDDLFKEKVFKLQKGDTEYLVPLWHNVMYFDYKDVGLTVNCTPILPEHIDIDEHNNLVVRLTHSITDALKEDIPFKICDKTFLIKSESLFIKKMQPILFKEQGIPRINEKKFYNIEEISDVIVLLELV